MTSRARDVGRSHHRNGTETRERAANYLDPDVWLEMESRKHDQILCNQVWGELLLFSAIIDSAMHAIFTSDTSSDWHRAQRDHGYTDRAAWVEQRQHKEIAWLTNRGGVIPGMCKILQDFGWSKTQKGWPTNYEKLCRAAIIGHERGLWLTPLTGGF